MTELEQAAVGTPNEIERSPRHRLIRGLREHSGQRLLAKAENRNQIRASAYTAGLDFPIRIHEILLTMSP
jgi:hypothetical protein